jgi:GDP-L-fucose synthase
MKYKKIMVTGASGVLGSALKAISSTEYPDREFIFLTSKDCDLTDMKATLETVRNLNPDGILHLAAVSGGIGLSMKHQGSMLRDIALMTFSILEAARKCKILKTVMTLTTGMYPTNAPLPLNEDDIHNGQPHESNYGSSFGKRLAEPGIRGYREEYGLNVIGLIPSGIFGEWDNFNYDDAPMLPALIRRFYEARKNGGDVVVWGDGSPLREYTYSKDIARIFMWALDNYESAQCINIGTTEENSIKDIAFMIADFTGVSRSKVHFDTNRPNGIYKKSTDNSRFMEIANFKYTPFANALENTIKWFRETYEKNPSEIRLYSKSKEDRTKKGGARP